jgi:hypothetical protein
MLAIVQTLHCSSTLSRQKIMQLMWRVSKYHVFTATSVDEGAVFFVTSAM